MHLLTGLMSGEDCGTSMGRRTALNNNNSRLPSCKRQTGGGFILEFVHRLEFRLVIDERAAVLRPPVPHRWHKPGGSLSLNNNATAGFFPRLPLPDFSACKPRGLRMVFNEGRCQDPTVLATEV